MNLFAKYLFVVLFFLLAGKITSAQQSGVGTLAPHPSAILDLNSANLGLKGPEVALQDIFDVTTIPSPAAGLIVFNTANSGTPPNEVYANAYYYWNGTSWFHIPTTRIIEEINKPGVFVMTSSTEQTITNINDGTHYPVDFSGATLTSVGNIASQTSNQIVTILQTGLYEISGFVNYNPNQSTGERRAMLNTYIERSAGGSGAWTAVAGGRTAWGRETTTFLQTAAIPTTCVLLNAGDQLRMTIANKITSGNRSVHGTPSSIQTTTNSPISKSLRIYLIGYEN